ncbi:fimbria/pilus periplasmic chaperone [Aeromonas media]|uniref:fimbria/pilus periplasmic chaperone n=1 Tax=Aeromonas media TaxID=651 RepID=UPI00223FBB6E|nr:fimbria/pilus periplasmic chaperone [Aeromonas media]
MKHIFTSFTILLLMISGRVDAAVTIDRTRVIFPGQSDSITLNIINTNKSLPYLAQAWLEDSEGKKIDHPFIVLPPIQRLEADSQSMLKIQALPNVGQLPQDRESLFYFNVREIPPKSDKPNTLQLALQTRVKFFYRPSSLIPKKSEPKVVWQNKLKLYRESDKFRIENPTPYFITITEAHSSEGVQAAKSFEAVMLSPRTSQILSLGPKQLGSRPMLTYVDDFGARRKLQFSCPGISCDIDPDVKY